MENAETEVSMSSKQRMLLGLPYFAEDPELNHDALEARRLEQVFNSIDPTNAWALDSALRDLIGAVGDKTVVRQPLRVDYGWRITFGSNCFVNTGLVALDVSTITIGDFVQIGPNVQLLTPTHPIDPEIRKSGLESAEPVTIGDNVWLGGGVIVCPGVTIGENTVVGAGSVVVKDLPANVVAVGNPARVVKTL